MVVRLCSWIPRRRILARGMGRSAIRVFSIGTCMETSVPLDRCALSRAITLATHRGRGTWGCGRVWLGSPWRDLSLEPRVRSSSSRRRRNRRRSSSCGGTTPSSENVG